MMYYITMPRLGVIGGSGLYEMPGLSIVEKRTVSTPFGEPSAPYVMGRFGEVETAFLPRHGQTHRMPPHRINYRANLWGFRELGVERVISVNATGGIRKGLTPGELVVLDQVIDMTQGAREGTFYDEGEVVHVDFTEPYCPETREALFQAGNRHGIGLGERGTYLCVNGPRLESRAEIEHFATMGADVVGMTGMPEAALARELELCFAALAVVTNHAAGLSGRKLTTDEVMESMESANERIKTVLKEALLLLPSERHCPCRDALKGARM
jgi:5'-methylthioadenosine phosphorylase